MDPKIHDPCNCSDMTKISMIMHIIIIIILIYVIWKITKVERLAAGDYIGKGLPNSVYTSGADQRFAQRFSSTDQGVNSTV